MLLWNKKELSALENLRMKEKKDPEKFQRMILFLFGEQKKKWIVCKPPTKKKLQESFAKRDIRVLVNGVEK